MNAIVLIIAIFAYGFIIVISDVYKRQLYGFGIVSIIAYPLTFVCEQLSKYVIFIVGTFSDIPFSLEKGKE